MWLKMSDFVVFFGRERPIEHADDCCHLDLPVEGGGKKNWKKLVQNDFWDI
jgi:hypothetical protein